jgi:hypothetical protein
MSSSASNGHGIVGYLQADLYTTCNRCSWPGGRIVSVYYCGIYRQTNGQSIRWSLAEDSPRLIPWSSASESSLQYRIRATAVPVGSGLSAHSMQNPLIVWHR